MSSPDEIADRKARFAEAVDRVGGRDAAAQILSIHPTHVNRLRRPGEEHVPREAYIVQLLAEAKSFDTESDGGHGVPPTHGPSAESAKPADGVRSYPVAPNGHGAAEVGRVNDDAAGQATIPDAMMRRLLGGRLPAEGFWTYAAGSSMEPFIPNGFPIFVEPETGPLIDGERYAVWLGEADADVVKRIEVGPKRSIVLRSDNSRVSARRLTPTDDDTVWRADDGETIRFVVQGRVTFPPDAPSATIAQLADFARALMFKP